MRINAVAIVYCGLILIGFLTIGEGIDCYKCVSKNGDNEFCDDPFHNNGSVDFLQSPCMGGRKGRDGLFPASDCVKIVGVYSDTGDTLTVRSCALDSGTLTTDTELIRMSHCGGFYFENRYLRGCVQSCSDVDGCNAATTNRDFTHVNFFLLASLLVGQLSSKIYLRLHQ